MAHLIDKDALVAEIDNMFNIKENTSHSDEMAFNSGRWKALKKVKDIIDTLEVIDPYKLLVQYSSVKDAIQAHVEDYSWNIESELFQQLTPEQQKLWRKEIEQACISGGYSGLDLAKDSRYKENLEVKEVDLEKEYKDFIKSDNGRSMFEIAKHFFKLGLKAKKGENE